MSKTRNNHYVPQWYQEGFFEAGQTTLAYLDLAPQRFELPDGRVKFGRNMFTSPTSRCFGQRDLYSTFFGTSINDEIERRLFGNIDTKGSNAVKAFIATDVSGWHRHFQTLFEYIDIQKVRTPKGLDWLKAQYPSLTQNELMWEMQGIRNMHCTIWTEGVREIVSAEDANAKFIISDHPVTVYNYAIPPDGEPCHYPYDPGIALKGSQTLFPLNRNFCLILTNLEYARDPSVRPMDKRTFARNFRHSMVRTDAFIRTRKLGNLEVAQINRVLKSRARRFIAAGRSEWLYPEQAAPGPWEGIRQSLIPPKNSLFLFGGELFAKFNDGHVHYQDEFGRTEKQRDFLLKPALPKPLRDTDACGCGSGRRFGDCCRSKPIAKRPSWNECSIRERNIMLYNAISNVLKLKSDSDWVAVRRELTDEQISEVYHLYEGLWPLETDLLHLLPKPDEEPRAIYTGNIHPSTIAAFAVAAPLYFGQVIIQQPFLHAGTVKKEFSPVENPKLYRREFLSSVLLFFSLMPLIGQGLVNLIPDPCDFDPHLRSQMWDMARARSTGLRVNIHEDAVFERLMKEDYKRDMLMMPQDALRARILKSSPELKEDEIQDFLARIERLKEDDPLAVLQDDSLGGGEKGGQLRMMKLAPNFEITLYLAQATGSSIVTDNLFRWNEIKRAMRPSNPLRPAPLPELASAISRSTFAYPPDTSDVLNLAASEAFQVYPAVMRDVYKYLSKYPERGAKHNVEQRLTARFQRAHASAQKLVGSSGVAANEGRIQCVFASGGIQDNSVNRLLLMSSSEAHLPNVPMAFYM
ncbi:MAG TPA: DUF4238 domain-containing protein, partial [Rhizomicrobium sp.]|nr:DUF4238 domain-containing protein [Rhizomicrobium sp.]